LVFARRFAHANRLLILSRRNHNYHDAAAMGSRAARMAWTVSYEHLLFPRPLPPAEWRPDANYTIIQPVFARTVKGGGPRRQQVFRQPDAAPSLANPPFRLRHFSFFKHEDWLKNLFVSPLDVVPGFRDSLLAVT